MKKNFLYIFFIIYFVVGSLASLNTGISHDEFHEQENWNYNIDLTKNLAGYFFLDQGYDTKYDNYKDKYYGIGFQIISQPIQHLLKNFIVEFKHISPYGATLVAKHFIVFLFFFFIKFFYIFDFEKNCKE